VGVPKASLFLSWKLQCCFNVLGGCLVKFDADGSGNAMWSHVPEAKQDEIFTGVISIYTLSNKGGSLFMCQDSTKVTRHLHKLPEFWRFFFFSFYSGQS